MSSSTDDNRSAARRNAALFLLGGAVVAVSAATGALVHLFSSTRRGEGTTGMHQQHWREVRVPHPDDEGEYGSR